MNRLSNIPLPRVFSKDMEPIGRLHPTRSNYHLKLTPLSTGGLELEGESVTPGQFVELFDTFGSVGVFRVSQTDTVWGVKRKQTVKLEHAFITLGDTVIAGYLEFGGLGTTTTSVLNMLLGMQKVAYWSFGGCDFGYSFQYSAENEYLANAILGIGSPFPVPYQWVYDTTVFPFRLSLRHSPTDVTMELRLNRNIQTVKQRVDFTKMRNRLIPKGYGEGVNQLDITSVNGGVNYIQNDTSIAAFGVVEDVYPDTKITDAATLLAAGQAVLEGCAMPAVTTEVSGEDVYGLTGEPLDSFRVGAVGRVPLVDYGISIEERVVEVKKSDIYGADQKATLVFSNQKSDITSDTAELLRKTRITELYSQGSTCLYAISFNGNCDNENPLEVWIPIDKNAASINVLQITYKVTAFRAYSKAAKSGGSQARTSDAGTQATANIPRTVFASTVNMTGAVDAYGDTKTLTDGNFGGNALETDAASGRTGASGDITTEGSGSLTVNSGGSGSTGSGGGGNSDMSDNTSHSHGISGGRDSTGSTAFTTASHYHSMGHSHSVDSSSCGHRHYIYAHSHSVGSHTHNLNSHAHVVPSHSHTLNSHRHTITEHQHGMAHSHGLSIGFTFPNMTINVSGHVHTVTFEAHTHEIEYGIYSGGTANSVQVKLGDNVVPAAIASTMDFDATPYMEKDSDGRIVRGWHKLTFVPDSMTGISGTAYVKTFVTAFSGGRY